MVKNTFRTMTKTMVKKKGSLEQAKDEGVESHAVVCELRVLAHL